MITQCFTMWTITMCRLVEEYPGRGISWFAVGCYYLCTRQFETARRYFGKATSMDNAFAAAWIGFGHSFAFQDESDQVDLQPVESHFQKKLRVPQRPLLEWNACILECCWPQLTLVVPSAVWLQIDTRILSQAELAMTGCLFLSLWSACNITPPKSYYGLRSRTIQWLAAIFIPQTLKADLTCRLWQHTGQLPGCSQGSTFPSWAWVWSTSAWVI